MDVCISGIDRSNSQHLVTGIRDLLKNTHGPVRLTKVKGEKPNEQILFLRERTWSEFLLEKLIRTPQEMTDIQNETLAAIELALFPLTDEEMNGAEKTSGKNNRHKAGKEEVPCLDDLSETKAKYDLADSASDDDINSFSMDIETCREWLKYRVLEDENLNIETPIRRSQTRLRLSNGLGTVPQGLSVTTCPALQVVAHKVIVGSVGAVSVLNLKPYSVLERAVEAFKSAWDGLELKTPPWVRPGGELNVLLDVLQCKRGLRHIPNLMCIADDRSRDDKQDFANQSQKFWKTFYGSGLDTTEGSVVRDLYPDYYIDDLNALGGRKPFYSDNNLEGAVAAAIEVRQKMRAEGKRPVSIMFAGMDENTYRRISARLKNASSH